MPEENVIVQEKPTVTIDPFDGSDKPAIAVKKQEPVIEKKIEEKPVVVEEKKPDIKDDEIIFDENDYVKREYGWENKEAGKKELESLRERVKELDLTNEDSRKIIGYIKEGKTKELYQFLHQQEELERIVNSDLSDKKLASELVKFGIANKNKTLTPEEVDFLFNERFSVPSKPVKGAEEEDEDYNERVDTWKNQVATIEKRLVIEAKLSQPELQKLKTELKLPDILKAEATIKEPTAEELQKAKEGQELFLKDAAEALKNFEGFNVTYKDKDVEVQSSYKLSDEENTNVLGMVKSFIEKGGNSDAIFSQRWVKDDKFDFNLFLKDLATLSTEDKRSQKYISDTAAKAKLQYMKGKHNIDLDNGNGGGDLQLEDKATQKKNEDAIWS